MAKRTARRVLLSCATLISIIVGFPFPAKASLSFDGACSGMDAEKPAPSRCLEFGVDEGTWINLDISPDGHTIVFDLLGEIYLLPVGGGAAKPLRRDLHWSTSPRFSPDGKEIWFISDLGGGARGLWAMPTAGGQARSIAGVGDNRADVVNYSWFDHSGGYVVERKGSVVEGKSQLEFFDTAANRSGVLDTATDRATSPTAGSRDAEILFAQPTEPQTGMAYRKFAIFAYDRNSGRKRQVIGDGLSGTMSRDGSKIAFYRLSGLSAELWVRDLKTGNERRLLESVGQPRASGRVGWHLQTAQGLMPSFAFGPDNRTIYVGASGKILRVDAENAQVTSIPFLAPVRRQITKPVEVSFPIKANFEAKQLRWLNSDKAGRIAAFSAAGAIWIGNLATGESRRVADGDGRDFAPALSPDGRHTAFIRWADGRAELRLVANRGMSRQSEALLSGSFLTQPAWSPDGKRVAVMRLESQDCKDAKDLLALAEDLCGRDHAMESVDLLSIEEFDINDRTSRRLYCAALPSTESLPRAVSHAPLVYSSDGRSLLFVELIATDWEKLRVSRLARESGAVHRIVEFSNTDAVEFAVPSPDEKFVALGANDGLLPVWWTPR